MGERLFERPAYIDLWHFVVYGRPLFKCLNAQRTRLTEEPDASKHGYPLSSYGCGEDSRYRSTRL